MNKKNGLDNSQVAHLLAALKNDKYTSEDDAEFLMENVLNTFSTSDDNRKKIMDEFSLLNRDVKKCGRNTLKNVELFKKAYKENKIIKVKGPLSFRDDYSWHRVCYIKECDGKLFVLLLPLEKRYHQKA